MRQEIPGTMRAVAINQFGGTEALKLETVSVPEIKDNQVLIQVESAGVGKWDVFEREGMFAQMYGGEPQFPYILGSEGAGTIAAIGKDVNGFQIGDQVYGLIPARNPKAGFYAEYTAVDDGLFWRIPCSLTVEQAGALAIDAGTGLRGLRDILELTQGATLMVFGASGGIGHMATQLAKRMGVRVLAVASGDDGVALARELGADAVVEGRNGDVMAAARQFAPEGLDAVLATAGGDAVDQALGALREGGRVAYPNGVYPEPNAPSGVIARNYNADYNRDLMEDVNRLINLEPFRVEIANTFSFDHALEAHQALDSHYLGRLALRPD